MKIPNFDKHVKHQLRFGLSHQGRTTTKLNAHASRSRKAISELLTSLIDSLDICSMLQPIQSSHTWLDVVTRVDHPGVVPKFFFLFGLVEDVGEVAATAILAVVHSSHEDTSTASVLGALAPQALNLAITINLVVLEDS